MEKKQWVIRKVKPGEHRAVWKVARTLGVLERYLFFIIYTQHRKNALVAVTGERIVGCVVPKVAGLGGEKIGTVEGIFVDRTVWGLGVGKALMDAALSYFQEEQCQTLYYVVDRFNSSSWNMALHYGYDIFEFHEQIRIYRWKIFLLWFSTWYAFAPGHFILRKRIGENWKATEVKPAWHFLFGWLGFSLVLLASVMTRTALSPAFIPLVAGVVGASVFVHELSHRVVARSLGLETVFKAWESGILFSVLSALLFGWMVPYYGSTFIKQKDWAYTRDARKMGLVYLAGPIVSLVLAFFFVALYRWGQAEWVTPLARFGVVANYFLAFFNLIPIFPFACFDGRRIFLWNKAVWTSLVVGIAFLTWFHVAANVL